MLQPPPLSPTTRVNPCRNGGLCSASANIVTEGTANTAGHKQSTVIKPTVAHHPNTMYVSSCSCLVKCTHANCPFHLKLQPDSSIPRISKKHTSAVFQGVLWFGCVDAACRFTKPSREQSSYRCYTQIQQYECSAPRTGSNWTTHRSIAITVKYDEPGLQATRKNKRVKTASPRAVEHPHATNTSPQTKTQKKGRWWHDTPTYSKPKGG